MISIKSLVALVAFQLLIPAVQLSVNAQQLQCATNPCVTVLCPANTVPTVFPPGDAPIGCRCFCLNPTQCASDPCSASTCPSGYKETMLPPVKEGRCATCTCIKSGPLRRQSKGQPWTERDDAWVIEAPLGVRNCSHLSGADGEDGSDSNEDTREHRYDNLKLALTFMRAPRDMTEFEDQVVNNLSCRNRWKALRDPMPSNNISPTVVRISPRQNNRTSNEEEEDLPIEPAHNAMVANLIATELAKVRHSAFFQLPSLLEAYFRKTSTTKRSLILLLRNTAPLVHSI
ncbi:hypothetical protein BKA70DRAFT_1229789 [Coprinopsis sp. MPI-PUGE-AT-0042]|nr:hypothetical protein BKA70DRAFT_1229789 [Coprinopsis sp. MPI-PUGE-AT-0042]